MKHVFVIKTKQKFPLYSEFLTHTQAKQVWFQFVHPASVWNCGWINLFNSYFSSDIPTHKNHHSIVSLGADHHIHPCGRSFCLLCQHKQHWGFCPCWVKSQLFLTHRLWSIKLLWQSLQTSHLPCSWLGMYDERVVWFYKALIKRNISSAIVILISRRGVESRPSS